MLFSRLLHWLLPPLCSLCGRTSGEALDPFCETCMAEIRPLPTVCCLRCALPFVNFGGSTPHLCGRCLLDPPSYSATYAVGLYERQLRHAIQRFKFQHQPNLDQALARLLDYAVPANIDSDLVVPVPIHPVRLRERTYHQSLLLARAFAKNRRIEICSKALVKIRHTVPQQELSARQRQTNLKDAYAVTRDVKGKSILLIDDVMTTGITVDHCARILLKKGAQEVRVAVVGRALL